MREFLLVLCKRRGQAKKPVVEMVDLCQNKLFDKLPTKTEKYKMLEALREATEGKMFLEREYAAATKTLCEYLEADGKAEEGTKIIQEIQIETYGSLETKEKVDFILYQMKLVLMRNDFVRCQILSRKISKRHLSEAGLEALKIQYYLYMIQYYVHEKMILDAAKAYQTIFDTINKAEAELATTLNTGGKLKDTSF
jgi:26S proteasome regulatory subunit N5